MSELAHIGVWIFVLWLSLIGGLMLLAPQAALKLLRKAGSSHFANAAELSLRFLFGLALMGAAAGSRFPDIVFYVGGFLAVTSVLIIVLPLKWHNGYAVWWADRLSPSAVRVFSPVTFAAVAVLIWAVVPGVPG